MNAAVPRSRALHFPGPTTSALATVSTSAGEEILEYFDEELCSADPLQFPNYGGQLARLEGNESVRTGRTATHVFVNANFSVLGGSMGVVHGERVVRAFDRATQWGMPVVIRSASGGARMQEGMLALIQMARTAAASERHRQAGHAQIAWLGDPTTGGVYASYASLATVKAAASEAYLGFGGPRVLEAFGEQVDHSHSGNFALVHGLIDATVPTEDAEAWIAERLGARSVGDRARVQDVAFDSPRGRTLVAKPSAESSPDPWEIVRSARAESHPTGIEVAQRVATRWSEHEFSDPVFRCADAEVGGVAAVLLATDRRSGSGRPTPQSYRAAQRALQRAGERGVPFLSFVDMPGADPSAASENGGIAREIAQTFANMMTMAVPTISVCVGEGGSGGALAIACGDQFACCADAFFSVIAPEGAAAILDRDRAQAPARARDLRLTAHDLLELGIADAVLPSAGELTAEDIAELVALAEVGQRGDRWDRASVQALRSTS